MTNVDTSKHTPGPWHVHHPFSQRSESVETEVWAGTTPVAQVTNLYATREQREANARLIAAAPLMLAALERIIAAYDGSNPSDLPPHVTMALFEGIEAIDQAKARGDA